MMTNQGLVQFTAVPAVSRYETPTAVRLRQLTFKLHTILNNINCDEFG